MTKAIVVGAGPNGLAAGVVLARHGVQVTVVEAAGQIGGGTRTSELTVPGLLHDHCSAIHPMGVGSPGLRELGLERYGVTWRWPEIDLAHPLDGGRAGLLHRSLARTCDELGPDGAAWQRLFEPLAEGFDPLVEDLFRPVLHRPRHPFRLTRFGMHALQPATWTARRWHTPEARALFAGAAAHAIYPLTAPTTSAVGLMLVAAAHRYGWPVAQGGSRSITDALATMLRDAGGEIETGHQVRTAAELTDAEIVMFDLAPRAVAEIEAGRLPVRVRRGFARYRHGPGAFKLDLAVDGGLPWIADGARRAGTVHVGGSLEEVAASEHAVARGRMPEQPFVLVGQQYLADPTRSVGDVHPVWAYAHVPSGYTGDAGDAILAQLERFAPGTRERIVGMSRRTTTDLASDNFNYVGGDIAAGANSPRQLVFRPRVALDPYSLGIAGHYICSAATPPGAGVHGMCGVNAARSALRHLNRRG